MPASTLFEILDDGNGKQAITIQKENQIRDHTKTWPEVPTGIFIQISVALSHAGTAIKPFLPTSPKPGPSTNPATVLALENICGTHTSLLAMGISGLPIVA